MALVNRHNRLQRRRRRHRSPSGSRPWVLWIFGLLMLAAASMALFKYGERYPLETLICAAAVFITLISIAGYVGELVIVGWIMDFLTWLTTPIIHAKQVPLDYDQVGEMIVVNLSDNIVTARQCQSVQKQLKRLIDEHHCDFILDFSRIGRVSIRFRAVMVHFARAARREARKQAKPHLPLAVPPGDQFTVFADGQSAVEEMGMHDGHGWVVLCSVPAGIRAVPEAM